MKDTTLHAILIAATFAAILASSFGDPNPAPQAATARAGRVLTMEKTVIAARRLPADVAVADSRVALIATP